MLYNISSERREKYVETYNKILYSKYKLDAKCEHLRLNKIKNRKYIEIYNRIESLKSNGKYEYSRQNQINHYKKNAYECFLYYVEKKKEETAVKEACRQMSIDSHKLNENTLGTLTLSIMANQNKTVRDMIHFIEGFN